MALPWSTKNTDSAQGRTPLLQPVHGAAEIIAPRLEAVDSPQARIV